MTEIVVHHDIIGTSGIADSEAAIINLHHTTTEMRGIADSDDLTTTSLDVKTIDLSATNEGDEVVATGADTTTDIGLTDVALHVAMRPVVSMSDTEQLRLSQSGKRRSCGPAATRETLSTWSLGVAGT